ncbi:MAG TPA: prepilin-type N-terminal cleavage/methylation domain-containing protein [Verrucomicrobiae bacterium]
MTKLNSGPERSSSPKVPQRGFTLIELLVVIAIIAILAAMLLPALARARQKTQGIYCMNDTHQLALATHMYASDNGDFFPPNRDGGNVGKAAGDAAWVGGWLDFSASTDNTNIAFLINKDLYPYAAYLGTYVKNPTAWKCPADRSQVMMGGLRMNRVRSISMQNYIGPMSRLWTGSSKWKMNPKMSSVKLPTMTFIFLDEREDSINDGWFATDPDTLFQIVDYPASYHGNAAGFAFVDGHSEIHRWRNAKIMPNLAQGQLLPLNVNLSGCFDVYWLAQHAAGTGVYP